MADRVDRCGAALFTVLVVASGVGANDWGMRDANAKLPRPDLFHTTTTPGDEITLLAWFVIAISAAILIVVVGLLVYCVVRYRARPGDDPAEPPQVYGSNPVEAAWTLVPMLITVVLVLATGRTIHDIQEKQKPPGAISVTVVGHQWWWEFRYPELGIVTANELHVPVSHPEKPTPTFLDLQSADVIHSFWAPRLTGKVDVIPNRTNKLWFDPREPGTFLGQCTEYCGTQHALMLVRVVVHPEDEWQRWVAEQKQPAVADPAVERGRRVFDRTACVSCHVVRGTGAEGRFGPDLTHLMSRETLAAGAALNTVENLRVWVQSPDEIKPGSLMPAMNLPKRDLDDLVAYLATLR